MLRLGCWTALLLLVVASFAGSAEASKRNMALTKSSDNDKLAPKPTLEKQTVTDIGGVRVRLVFWKYIRKMKLGETTDGRITSRQLHVYKIQRGQSNKEQKASGLTSEQIDKIKKKLLKEPPIVGTKPFDGRIVFPDAMN